MRRLLAAVLSSAIAMEPMAAANATPYARFQPQGMSEFDGSEAAASGISGPNPIYGHVYSFTQQRYALSSGKAATFAAPGLPQGLSMAADGTLSGAPYAPFSGTVVVTATLANGSVRALPVDVEVHDLLQANYPTDKEGFVGQAGHVNVALSIPAPTLSGGPVQPVTWKMASGSSLPQGLALNQDGTITGTPREPGDYGFKVQVVDASGADALTQSFDLSVADGIHVADLPDLVGHVGVALVPIAGVASGTIASALTWGITGGSLPSGLSLDKSTGTVSGTSMAATDMHAYRLSAVDSTGIPAYSSPFNVTIYPPVAVAVVPDMSMHVGQPYTSPAFGALNSPISPRTWRLTPGTALPAGLGVDADNGYVTGQPTTQGTATVSVDLVDAQGEVATSNAFNVSALDPLSIAAIPDQTVNSGQSATFVPVVSGTPVGNLSWSTKGYRWGVDGSQDAKTGALTLHSTYGVSGSFSIVASDDSGATVQSNAFNVNFQGPYVATAPAGGTFRQGDVVALAKPVVTANASAPGGGGAKSPVTWAVRYAPLPAGLSIDPKTGIVSGTLASNAQSSTFTLFATDASGVGVAASPDVAVSVLGPLAIQPTTVSAHVGDAVSVVPVLDSTATQPVTWTYTGTLPAGLTFDSATGAITGTPTGSTTSGAVERPTRFGTIGGALRSLASLAVSPAEAAQAPNTTTIHVQAKDAKGYVATVDVPMMIAPVLSVGSVRDVSARVGDTVSIAPPALSNAVGTPAWSLPKGVTIPSWMTLDTGTGTLSGTANSVYSGSVRLHVTDDAKGSGTDSSTFTVSVTPALAIANLPPSIYAATGKTFSSPTPSVQNGPVGTLAWSVVSHLPNGFPLDVPKWIKADPATGVVTGSTTTLATVNYLYVHVVDGAGSAAEWPFSVVVANAFDMGDMPSTTVRLGDSLSVTGPALGREAAGPVSFSLASGSLPSGVALDASTGTIHGRPTTRDGSPYALTLQAIDSKGQVGVGNSFLVSVTAPLSVDAIPDVTTYVGGQVSTQAPNVSNAPVAPLSWTVASGSLPGGVKLDRATGKLSGATPVAGSYKIALKITDSSAAADSAVSPTFTLTVQPPLSVAAPKDQAFRVGLAQTSAAPVPSNPIGAVSYALNGKSQAGLSFDTTAGVVTGTPTAAGTAAFTVTVTDSLGQVATTPSFNVTVQAPLSLAATPDVVGHVGSMLAILPPAVSGNPTKPLIWSVAGTLPTGVTANADGSVTVKSLDATTVGSYALTYSVQDATGAGATAMAPFNLAIRGPLSMAKAADVTVTMNADTVAPAPIVAGNPASPTWSLVSGALPRGLSLRATDGAIVGQATKSGTYPVSIGFAEAGGASLASNAFNVVVPALTLTLANQTAPLNTAATVPAPAVANGAKAPLSWSQSGTLPKGLAFAAGALSGAPTQVGDFPVTVAVTDANGETGSVSYDVVVPPLTLAQTDQTVPLNTKVTIPAPVPAAGVAASPVTWKLSGTLPAGLAFSTSTGSISGTVTAPVATSLTIGLTDANGVTASAPFKLVVPAPVVATVADVALSMNTPVKLAAPSVDKDPNVTLAWSLSVGSLPSGLVANADGTVTGQVTAPGSFPVALAFKDANGLTGQTNVFTLVVAPLTLAASVGEQDIPLNKATSLPAPTINGTPASQQSWTLASGSLPGGLALASATGVISGTATRSGTYAVSLRLVDGNGQSVTTNAFNVVVVPLSITGTPSVASFHQNDPAFAVALPAVLGNPAAPVTWSVSSGALPAGVTYNVAKGAFVGPATGAGAFTAALKVTDANGETATSTSFSFSVLPPLLLGAVSDVYLRTDRNRPTASLSVYGNPQGTLKWSLASGTLPTNAVFDATQGTISGQPTSTGDYPISLAVTDATGATATSAVFTLHVIGVLSATAPATVSLHASAPAALVANSAAIVKYATPPARYSLFAGTLPTGMSIDPATGLISGSAPTQQQYTSPQYSIAELVTDADGETAHTANYSLQVLNPVTTTTPVATTIHPGAVANAAPTLSYATGTPSWTFASGSTPPAGMTVATATGVVSTTSATPAGTYNVALTATDATNASVTTGTFAVTVVPAVVLAGPASILMRVGVSYPGFQFTQSNAIGTITFKAPSGPAGMTFPATGLYAGTPSSTTSVGAVGAPGTLAVSVVDTSSTSTTTGTGTLSVPFTYLGTALGITANAGGTWPIGQQVSIPAPTVTGTPVNPVYTLGGSLPAGLSLNADGSITGTSTSAATATLTMTVKDDTGASATSAQFTISTQAATLASASYPSSIASSSGTAVTPYAMYDASTSTNYARTGSDYLTYTFAGPVTATAALDTDANTAAGNLVLWYNAGSPTAPAWTQVPSAGAVTSTMFQVRSLDTSGFTIGRLRIGYNAAYPAFLQSIASGSATVASGIDSSVNLDAAMASANVSGAETWTSTTTLPAGVSISGSKLLVTKAFAATTGSYSYKLALQDSRGIPTPANAATLSLTVSAPPTLAAANSTLVQGTAYAPNLNSIMGGANVVSGSTWTVTGLPAGVTVASASSGTSATLSAASGNAVTLGTYPLQVTVTTPGGLSGTATLTLYVDTQPAMAAGTVNNAAQGLAYSGPLSTIMSATGVTAGATWTLAAASGTLPSGYAVSGTGPSATLTAPAGNAAAPGTYPINVTVTNVSGLTVTKALSLTVQPLPTLAAASDSFAIGRSYTATLATLMSATNLTTTATWAISGAPANFSVTGTGPTATFVASGTSAMTAGAYPVSVTVTNPGGLSSTATLTLTAVTYTALNNAALPAAYGQALSVSLATIMGGSNASDTTWTASYLAPGLTLSPTGTLSGTPSAVGPFVATISLNNAGTSLSSSATLSTTVAAPPYLAGTSKLVGANQAFSFALPALMSAGLTNSPTYSAANLPAGAFLSTDGAATLAGTVANAGSYAIPVTLTNGNGTSATATFTLLVDTPPSLTAGTVSLTAGASTSVDLSTVLSPANLSSATWTASGLPGNLSLSTAGLLTGTAASTNNGIATVTVTNADGLTASAVLTLAVPGGTTLASAVYPASALSVCGGVPYGNRTCSIAATVSMGYDSNTNSAFATDGTFSGVQYTFATPVVWDGSVSAYIGPNYRSVTNSSDWFYYNSGTVASPNWVRWTSSSTGTVTTSQIQVVAGDGSGNGYKLSTARIGYGGVYPAYLPSGTAASVALAQGKPAAINLDTLLATTTAVGAETWAVASGTLPPGMSINGGFLSGTPTTAQSATAVNLAVTDSRGLPSAPVAVTLTVAAPPSIVSANLTVPYNSAMTSNSLAATMAATGLSGATWTATGLPTGLGLSTAGALTGTVTAATGSYPVAVTVANSSKLAATATLNVNVSPPPSIMANTLSPVIGQALSVNLADTMIAMNLISPTWTSTTLPAGLVLSSSGVLSGTPTGSAAGSNVTVTVTNLDGTSASANLGLQVQVGGITYASTTYPSVLKMDPAFMSTWLPFYYNQPNVAYLPSQSSGCYPNRLEELDYAVPVTTDGSMDNDVPGGVSLYYNSGTPASPVWTSANGTVTASQFKLLSNSSSCVLQFSRLRIGFGGRYAAFLPTISTATAYMQTGVAGNVGLDQVMGSANVSGTEQWTLVSGTMPAGLSLNGNRITGTPTTAGSANLTLTVADSRGYPSASKVLTLNVTAKPSLSNASIVLAKSASASASLTTVMSAGNASTWGWTATGLPPTLSLSGSGILTGTPTATGTYQVYVTNTAGGNLASTATLLVNVDAPPALSAGTVKPVVGQAYSASLSDVMVAANLSSPTWTSSTLPAGLSLSTAGVLSGTPTASGTTSVTVTVTNADGLSTTGTLTVTVYTTPSLSPASQVIGSGKAASVNLATLMSGVNVSSSTWTATGLPSTLSVASATGVLSGTPTATGNYTVSVTATNGGVTSGSSTLTLNVDAPPALSAATVGPVIGQAYSASLSDVMAAANLSSPTWTSSTLPAGLSLSSAGVLSGTPTASGTTSVTVTVTNADGLSTTGTLTVKAYTVPSLSAASLTLPNGNAASASLGTVMSGVNVSSSTWTATGLPSTLSVASATGILSGTPTTTGNYTVSVTATNGGVTSASATLTLSVVVPPTLTTAGYMLQTGQQASISLDQVMSIANATGTETWNLTSGSLPNGLTFDAGGTITGTPTGSAGATLTVSVTDGRGATSAATTLALGFSAATAYPTQVYNKNYGQYPAVSVLYASASSNVSTNNAYDIYSSPQYGWTYTFASPVTANTLDTGGVCTGIVTGLVNGASVTATASAPVTSTSFTVSCNGVETHLSRARLGLNGVYPALK